MATTISTVSVGQKITALFINLLVNLVNILNPSKRNHALNSDFSLWQRALSFTTAGYTADRWRTAVLTAGTFARATLSPGWGTKFGWSWIPSSSTNALTLVQALPSDEVQRLSGQLVLMQHKLQSSIAGVTAVLKIQISTTADADAAATWTDLSSTTVTLTTTPTVYNTTPTVIPSTAAGVRLVLILTNVSTAAIIYGSQVQCEISASPSVWNLQNYSTALEKMACFAYYARLTAAAGATFGVGQATGASTGTVFVQLPLAQRVVPPVVSSSGVATLQAHTGGVVITAVTNINCTGASLSNGNIMLDIQMGSGYRAGDVLRLQGQSPAAWIDFSAEL